MQKKLKTEFQNKSGVCPSTTDVSKIKIEMSLFLFLANNWGVCENGNAGIGCGPQETYRNCADIVVRHEMGIRGPFISRDYSRSKQLGQLVIGEKEPSLEKQSAVINDDFVTFHKLQ